MKKCIKCGQIHNDTDNNCAVCGGSLEFVGNAGFGEVSEQAVSTKEWLKFWCLSLWGLIPFVGWIIYLVLLIRIATGSAGKPISMRNFVRAQFIWMAIILAISIILWVIIGGVILAALGNMVPYQLY